MTKCFDCSDISTCGILYNKMTLHNKYKYWKQFKEPCNAAWWEVYNVITQQPWPDLSSDLRCDLGSKHGNQQGHIGVADR